MTFIQAFRTGVGIAVGAVAGIGHIVLQATPPFILTFLFASLFLNPLSAPFLAFNAAALYLVGKTILAISNNRNRRFNSALLDNQTLLDTQRKHAPVAQAIFYGCKTTNAVADSSVYAIQSLQYNYRSSSFLKGPGLAQKTIDLMDGVPVAKTSSFKL